jgi:hypothetical protein
MGRNQKLDRVPNPVPIDESKLSHDLDFSELGQSSSEIARNLDKLGCYGPFRTSCGCPLSSFLSKRLGGSWHMFYGIARQAGADTAFKVPNNVWQFVCDFDNGLFPFLRTDYRVKHNL